MIFLSPAPHLLAAVIHAVAIWNTACPGSFGVEDGGPGSGGIPVTEGAPRDGYWGEFISGPGGGQIVVYTHGLMLERVLVHEIGHTAGIGHGGRGYMAESSSIPVEKTPLWPSDIRLAIRAGLSCYNK